MRFELKTVCALWLFALIGCGPSESLAMDQSLVSKIPAEALQFVERDGREVLIAKTGEGEAVVENLRSWGRIGEERFFLFSGDNHSEAFLAVEAEGSGGFNVYSYDDQYSLLIPEHGLLAEVLPHNQLTGLYTFRVINPVAGTVVAERELDFDLSRIGSDDLPSFNYVEPRLRFGTNETTGHPFIELANVQAGYTTSKLTYWIDGAVMRAQGVGESDHDDISRPTARVGKSVDSWRLRFDGMEMRIPELPEGEIPVTGVANPNGELAVVTHSGGDKEEIANYTLWVFSAGESTGETFAIDEHFVYQDPIEGITGGSWTDEVIILIIDTSEFNYDFLFYVNEGAAESFLRSSDYDRFVR